MICILAIWSWSLLQFTLVLTATRARRDQTQCVDRVYGNNNHDEIDTACCTPEIYGIVVSILLQDLPFLVLRMLLIFHYGVLSYTNMFFTAKNSLVIALLVYRLVVIQMERRDRIKIKKMKENDPYLNMSESNSRAKLMSSSLSDPWAFARFNNYDSDTMVNLREPEYDPNEKPVEYVIKRHISQNDLSNGKPAIASLEGTGNINLVTPTMALKLLKEQGNMGEAPPIYADSEFNQSEYDNTEDFSSHV